MSDANKQLPPRQRWNRRYAGLERAIHAKPLPFIEECLARLPRQGRALDVAAGAGRHTLALARRGWPVDAVDISEQGVHLARQRVREAGFTLGREVNLILADVERPWLPHREYGVIVVAYFLYRPLFGLLKERLQPGGWLVYETFTIEQQEAPYFHKTPRRHQFLVEPAELRAAFADFEIEIYREGWHRRKATARLLARKPAR